MTLKKLLVMTALMVGPGYQLQAVFEAEDFEGVVKAAEKAKSDLDLYRSSPSTPTDNQEKALKEACNKVGSKGRLWGRGEDLDSDVMRLRAYDVCGAPIIQKSTGKTYYELEKAHPQAYKALKKADDQRTEIKVRQEEKQRADLEAAGNALARVFGGK